MRKLAWMGLLVLGFAPPVRAYVLPAEALCRMLAETRRQYLPRDITLQLNTDLVDHDHQVDERLYLKRPERARLEQQDDTTWISIDREGQSAAGEARAIKGTGPSINLLPVLLLPKGKDTDDMGTRVLRGLQSVGIDTKVVNLGRLNDTICYIIGAHTWETDKPQVWLNKDTYAPVRFIVPRKVDDKLVAVETRLLDYGGSPGGPGVPRVFEEYHDGKLVRHAEVTAAQVDTNLPETLFQWSRRST